MRFKYRRYRKELCQTSREERWIADKSMSYTLDPLKTAEPLTKRRRRRRIITTDLVLAAQISMSSRESFREMTCARVEKHVKQQNMSNREISSRVIPLLTCSCFNEKCQWAVRHLCATSTWSSAACYQEMWAVSRCESSHGMWVVRRLETSITYDLWRLWRMTSYDVYDIWRMTSMTYDVWRMTCGAHWRVCSVTCGA